MKKYKKFTLTIPEIHHSIREVLAETQEEAEALVKTDAYWERDIQYCSELYPINCVVSDPTEAEIEKWNFQREWNADKAPILGLVTDITESTDSEYRNE